MALVVIAAAQLMIILDATIVNVALPHMQRALAFSGSGLEWVVTAYSLTFGGLLLLGGRLGDIYGRRRIFIIGILVFSLASLAGGFATTQWWLLATRALQGVGAALASPTALALIATTFPEGQPRNRAFGIYAAMSGAGGATGLILGGVLTTYVSWRWVLFVNVPIGLAVIALAPFVLSRTQQVRARLDIPGALTSSAGLALLVYGLIHAAAGPSGAARWSSPVTIGALTLAVALLVAFVLLERRSPHGELPLHLLAQRRRAGAYAMMLLFGMALFASIFLMTVYVQTVWGYSPVKAGIAWLPMPVTLITLNLIVARVLVSRIGTRPLLLAGPLLAGLGFALLSRLSVTGNYWTEMFVPLIITAAGFGLMFVPLTLTAVSGVDRRETGVASGLLNTGQQLGGVIGLAAIGTIAWTGVAHTVAAQTGRGAPATAQVLHHAMTVGFSSGMRVAAAVAASGFLIALLATWSPRARVVRASEPEPLQTHACDPVAESC